MDGLLPSAEKEDEYDEDDEGLREYLKDDMDPDLFDVQSDLGGDGRTSLSLSHSLSTVAAIEDLPDDSSQEAGPLVGGSSRPLPSSDRPLDPAILEEVQKRKETHTLRPVVGGKGKFWKASELPFEVLSYVSPPSLLLPLFFSSATFDLGFCKTFRWVDRSILTMALGSVLGDIFRLIPEDNRLRQLTTVRGLRGYVLVGYLRARLDVAMWRLVGKSWKRAGAFPSPFTPSLALSSPSSSRFGLAKGLRERLN